MKITGKVFEKHGFTFKRLDWHDWSYGYEYWAWEREGFPFSFHTCSFNYPFEKMIRDFEDENKDDEGVIKAVSDYKIFKLSKIMEATKEIASMIEESKELENNTCN